MKKQSKLLALLLACAMTLALSACGGNSATTSTPAGSAAPAASGSAAATGDKTYTIGICQLVQHNALDAATKGFKDALTEKLGDKVKFVEQNAAGDSATCATICNQFVSSNVDLIMANAAPALQAATAATNSIPILGTSVTDYGTALSIADWKGTTGTNVTGTADLAPLDKQAEMIKTLFPDKKNVGILYCSAEPNSKYQSTEITKYLTDAGYTCKEYTFADSNDVAAVTKTACDESDVLYVPTDNTAASCAESINNIAEPSAPAAAWQPYPSTTMTWVSSPATWHTKSWSTALTPLPPKFSSHPRPPISTWQIAVKSWASRFPLTTWLSKWKSNLNPFANQQNCILSSI